MHDKYYYESALMALIDTDVKRTFATGIAGFSHVVDSLCAIKYAKVKTVRDESGVATGFEVEGDFPHYGNVDTQHVVCVELVALCCDVEAATGYIDVAKLRVLVVFRVDAIGARIEDRKSVV